MLSYNYIFGRLRSKESALISGVEWQRLADAPDYNAWLDGLKNSPYYSYIEKATTFEQFESGLVKYLKDIKTDLFGEMHIPFAPLLWKKYDLHNFKVLLKTKLGFKDLKKYSIALGEVPLSELEAFVLGNEKSGIKLKWQKLLREAIEVYETNGQSFSSMDDFLDRDYFKTILPKASAQGGAVKKYFQYQIDFANLRLWLYSQHNPTATISYIAQGHQPSSFFTMSGLTREQVLNTLFPGVKDNPDISLLQKNIDDYVAKELYGNRFLLKGILPIIIFFQAKEAEIKNLKTLYLMHTKNIPTLQPYLRAAYV